MYSCHIEEESAAVVRERLILEQLPQVNMLARRFAERLPQNVCLDDLISSGILGLISAVDNFKPALGVKLKTYAEHKIRGAILDSLRGMDWASRHRRTKSKEIEAAINSAEQRLHRAPTEDEVAAELGITLEAYWERLLAVQGINLESLEKKVGADGNQNLLSVLVATNEPDPSEAFERAELERLLAKCIDQMAPIERTILSLYYTEELTLREIAEVVNLHISRVSALKSQATLRLRARMVRQWPAMRGRLPSNGEVEREA